MPLAARPPLCFITNDTSATMYGLLLSAACYWCAKLSALTRKTGQGSLIDVIRGRVPRRQKDLVNDTQGALSFFLSFVEIIVNFRRRNISVRARWWTKESLILKWDSCLPFNFKLIIASYVTYAFIQSFCYLILRDRCRQRGNFFPSLIKYKVQLLN